VGAASRLNPEASGVHLRAGEFVTSELSQIACEEIRVQLTIRELLRLAMDRQHGLIFAVDVAHVETVTAELTRLGESVASVTGATPADERADRIARFKGGGLRWLVNCNVLTTGFDAPATDVLALLRPTASKSLHVQMLGRGMRRAKGKENCLVLDFSGNIRRHGSLDLLTEYKQLPSTKEPTDREKAAQAARQRQLEHSTRALAGDPMTGALATEEWRVMAIHYAVAPAKKYPDKTNVVVTYRCEGGQRVQQWLCVEYPGGARWHAAQWFQRRGLVAPSTAMPALALARTALKPESISVYFEGQWPRVAIEHFPTAGGGDDEGDEAAA
jgi:DNA repair protein RadD